MKLLERRHAEDVFVPECKNGPTWTSSHFRLDAWAMTRSWTNFRTFGYEVKVTRSDFLSDSKMHNYMSMCNQFFVVCPPGVVKSPEEVPADAGLLQVTSTGSMLITKKKAPFREIPDPVDLYRYVLMARTKIVHDTYYRPEDARAFWEGWLKDQAIDREFGRHVGKQIRGRIQRYISEVSVENDRLKRENADLKEVKQILAKMGIDSDPVSKYFVIQKLREYRQGFPEELHQAAEWAKNSAETLVRALAEMKRVLAKQEDRGV